MACHFSCREIRKTGECQHVIHYLSLFDDKPVRWTLGIKDRQILCERAGRKCQSCGRDLSFHEMQAGRKTARSKGGSTTQKFGLSVLRLQQPSRDGEWTRKEVVQTYRLQTSPVSDETGWSPSNSNIVARCNLDTLPARRLPCIHLADIHNLHTLFASD